MRTRTCAKLWSFAWLTCVQCLPVLRPRASHVDERRSFLRYLVLGEQLTPHLATLSTAQLKLVTIYINKTTKARADRLDAPHI